MRKKKFSDMHDLANEALDNRQIKALTNNNRKVCNNAIKENNEVCVSLPRNKSN